MFDFATLGLKSRIPDPGSRDPGPTPRTFLIVWTCLLQADVSNCLAATICNGTTMCIVPAVFLILGLFTSRGIEVLFLGLT